MKTRRQVILETVKKNDPAFRSEYEISAQMDSPMFKNILDNFMEAMEEYALLACLEQKMICADVAEVEILEHHVAAVDKVAIVNAPTPELL